MMEAVIAFFVSRALKLGGRPVSFAFAALVLGLAAAQVFSPDAYYQQCLRFEAGGDLGTARQNCLNALELDADLTEASLALARIELALGNVAAAEARLGQISSQDSGPELYVLLAEAALLSGRNAEAEEHLSSARSRLSEAFTGDLDGRLNYVAGQSAEAQAEYPEAVAHYQAAILADQLEERYRLALARLLFRLGQADDAQSELETFERLTADDQNPELLSALGRLKWGQSDLSGAARDLETAVALRGSGQGNAQGRDLQALALIYFGQGDLRQGALALQAALGQGSLLMDFLNRNLLWLALLTALLGVHLLGEGRAPGGSAASAPETPALWSVGDVYSVLFLSLLVAFAAALVYSVLVYDNFLAFFTPAQSADVQGLYFAVLAVALVALALWRVRRSGWDPSDRLLGSASQLPAGLLLGLGLLALTLIHLVYQPDLGRFLPGGYYLDLFRLHPTVAAAALLLPLAELFFCAYAIPPFLKRYRRGQAVALSSLLFALVLATPVLLLLALGWLLAELFVRNQSGSVTVVAKLVVNVGLLLGVAFIPFVRALFF